MGLRSIWLIRTGPGRWCKAALNFPKRSCGIKSLERDDDPKQAQGAPENGRKHDGLAAFFEASLVFSRPIRFHCTVHIDSLKAAPCD
jgi:hypothetical protein